VYEPAWVRAATPSGPYYAQEEDVAAWGAVISTATLYQFRGAAWFCLDALGASVRVDLARLTAQIEFPAEMFAAQNFQASREDAAPVIRNPGGFFNYDLRADHIAGETTTQGTWEAGWFGSRGVLTSSAATEQRGHVTTRLDTTWRYDDAERVTSLIVGDTFSRSSNYSRGVRLAGVQYARNFGNRPLLITYPTAQVQGSAVVPSTVDVIVNNARAYTTQVGPGPFSISNLPVPAGAGEMQVVVRDLFGQESTSVVPFISQEELLRKGLSDFSYEAGWLREEYGVKSNLYGDFAAIGAYRYGLTNRISLAARLEAMRDRGNAGGLFQASVPILGIIEIGGALSSADSTGHLGVLAFRRRNEQFQIGASMERRSDDFSDISDVPGLPHQTDVDRAYVSWASHGRWSVNAQWFRARDTLGEVVISSATFNTSLFRSASLSVGLSRLEVGTDRQTVTSAFLSVPLGTRDYVSASWEDVHENNTGGAMLQYGRNLLQNDSFGYEALVGETDSAQRWILRGAYQSRIGQLGIETANLDGLEAARAYMRGGVAMAGGSVKLSRYLDSSFAIVKVADFPDVQLYSNNQPIVRTDRHGVAVLPQLTPFMTNTVSFEPDDVPIEGIFEDNREGLKLPYRMGTLLPMNVVRRLSATLTLLKPDGTPVPSGALAVIRGGDEVFYVGRNGHVFVSGFERGVEVELRVAGGEFSCGTKLRLPKDFVSGSLVGPLTCE